MSVCNENTRKNRPKSVNKDYLINDIDKKIIKSHYRNEKCPFQIHKCVRLSHGFTHFRTFGNRDDDLVSWEILQRYYNS